MLPSTITLKSVSKLLVRVRPLNSCQMIQIITSDLLARLFCRTKGASYRSERRRRFGDIRAAIDRSGGSPQLVTNSTNATESTGRSFTAPRRSFVSTTRFCGPSFGPMGITIRPFGRSCATSACGIDSAAAVTMMASKGACAGQPFAPSPGLTWILALSILKRSSGLTR